MESQSFGFVRLDSCMADDISVVNSARVSFAKSQQEMDESAKGLINFLMREKHGTPFEHNAFRFHVKCPVFVAREWFRHRIGSFNEFSARYSEVGEDFFVPYQNDVRSQVGKPGAYEFHMVEEEIADQAIEIINQANSIAYESYKKLIDIGVAKELSRTVLPVGMYTQFYWTVNARSLMNFLSLRLSKTAQLDIRRYAKSVEAIFADKMPVTYKAWVQNGMNCP
jgi:thymidylate synthase (FAD)